MIVIAGLARIKPGTRAAVDALAAEVVGKTRPEEGCISYTMHAVPDGLFIFEEWASEETLRAHLAAPHTNGFLAAMTPHLAEPPALQRYEVTSVRPLF